MLSTTDIDMAIKSDQLEIPIHGIDIDPETGRLYVNYCDHATPEQRTRGDQLLADLLTTS